VNCTSWSITTIPSSAFVANALSSGYRDPRSTYRPTPAGIPISRDRVPNLMRRMGLRAIYQKLRTTVPVDPSERFPCLVDLSAVTAHS
jgi:hypothetical protein